MRLRIASIGVDSALMNLGLRTDGSMEVPPGGFPAGWYTGGPTPGELGPAVIAGHVDMFGPGVFYKLHDVLPGEQVTVTRRTAANRYSASRGLRSSRKTSSPPSSCTATSTTPGCG